MAYHSPGPQHHSYVMMASSLHPEISEDTLTNFLEAKTGIEVEEIRYSQDRCTALVTFMEKPDEKAIEKTMRRQLGGQFIQLSAVEDTSKDLDKGGVTQYSVDHSPEGCLVKVSGLHPDTPGEDLTNYLESMADADIKQITWAADRCTAYVTFQEKLDVRVIQDIIQRKKKKICGRIPDLSQAEQTPWTSDVQQKHTDQPQFAVTPNQVHVGRLTHTASVTKQTPVKKPTQAMFPSGPHNGVTWSDHNIRTESTWGNTDSVAERKELSGHQKQYRALSKKPVALPSHISQLIENNAYARIFVGHALQEWGIEVDGVTRQPCKINVDKPSFRSPERKHTGSTYDDLSPSEALSLMKQQFPELMQKVFIHGDDHEEKLYLMGQDENISEAMHRLELAMRNRVVNISDGAHVSIALTEEEILKLHKDEQILKDIAEQGREGGLRIEMLRGRIEIKGDSVSVQIGKKKVQEMMSLVRGKKESVDGSAHVDTVMQDFSSPQLSMPHSASLTVSELMAKAFKTNHHIRTYVADKFKELNYGFDIGMDDTVIVSASSPASLERAKGFLFRLVIETTFDWKTEPAWYVRSVESIKNVLLTSDAFGKKVIFSERPMTLKMVCTNETLPSAEEKLESLKDSFKSVTIDIPHGIDLTVEECEEYIQTAKGIKDKVKIVVGNDKATILAHCDDVSFAEKAIGQLVRQKEKEKGSKTSRADIRSRILEVEYTPFPEDLENLEIEEHFHGRDYDGKNPSNENRFQLTTDEPQVVPLVFSDSLDYEDFKTITGDLEMYEEDEVKQPSNIAQKGSTYKETLSPPATTKDNGSPLKKNTKTYAVPKSRNSSNSDTVTFDPNSGCTMDKHIVVKAFKADITNLDVDVIVSSANGQLSHGAGVSKAIADAAGPSLTREGNDLLRRRGEVKVTEIAVTTAGRLPNKKVFHAVGPHWHSYTDKHQCLEDLCCTILRCLCEAEELKMKSIAISSISSGTFGVPVQSCVQMYIRALRSFDAAVKTEYLKEVNFVDVNDKIVSLIQKEVEKMWGCPVEPREFKKDNDFIKMCQGKSLLPSTLQKPDHSLLAIDEDSECVICLNTITHPKRLRCGHVFCTYCINKAFDEKRICPICMSSEDSLRSLVPESVFQHVSSLSGKVDSDCAICLEKISTPKKVHCGHYFCSHCIDSQFRVKPVCPICYCVCGIITGNMPPGKMNVGVDHSLLSLPGYEDVATITIEYVFKDGTQTDDHPSPGRQYKGRKYTAFLPDNPEGQKILALLQVAWERRLTFTIENNMITWNEIHHKTDLSGGPQNNGYPDPMYLRQVEEELVRVGVTEDSLGSP